MDKITESSHSAKITYNFSYTVYPRGIERQHLNLFMFYCFSFSGVNSKNDRDVVHYALNNLLSFFLDLRLPFNFFFLKAQCVNHLLGCKNIHS